MTCRMFDAKSLTKPVLSYHQGNFTEISIKLLKYHWNTFENGVYFALAVPHTSSIATIPTITFRE